jgi:hypothetical protein
MYFLTNDVYIDQQQYDDLMAAIQTLTDKISDIHTVNAHLLITIIFFGVVAIWTVFCIETILKPIGDD